MLVPSAWIDSDVFLLQIMQFFEFFDFFLCQTLLDMPLPACFYLSPRSLLLRSRSEDQQAKRLELVIRT